MGERRGTRLVKLTPESLSLSIINTRADVTVKFYYR